MMRIRIPLIQHAHDRLIGARETNKEHQHGKRLDHLLEQLPAKRRSAIEARACELASLKDLRQTVAQFPDRPPVVIDHLTPSSATSATNRGKLAA
ncbi:MAG: hypothetical protein Q8O52_07285 [Sulfuritalea sp.]|nr:hypothetical protein [Sulfuritalea sp.]